MAFDAAVDDEPKVAWQRLNRGQYAALSDVTARILVLEGGYRGGKTFALACKAIDLARRNWPTPVVFGAPTWPMVEQVFVETMREVCAMMGIAMSWHARLKVLTIFRRRPCKIICRSLDNPRSAEGLTGSAAVVDEWELCNVQAIKTLNARITKGRACQLVLGGTPEGFGPAYDLILKKPAPSTRTVSLPTEGNAHNLKDGYIDDQREVLDATEQAEKLGGVRQARGGLVYRRFDRTRNFGRCIDLREHVDVEMWCDFNVGAQCWFIVEVDRPTKRFHVAQEVIGYDVDTDQQAVRATSALAAYMTERFRRPVTVDDVKRLKIKAPCDASGRNRGVVASHAQVLTSHGFRPQYHSSGNPDVEDRVLSVNLALAKTPTSLTIDERRCEFLARAITQQGRDPSGAPKKAKDPRQDLSGPNDALGYGIWWHAPTYRYRPNVVEQPRAPTRNDDDDVLR